MIAGCGGAEPPPSPKAPGAPASPAAKAAFDPPRTFDMTAGHPVPESAVRGRLSGFGALVDPLPMVLEGSRGFVASVEHLEVVDLASGAVTGTLTPENEPALSSELLNPLAGNNPVTAPVRADLGGATWLVTAFAATVKGEGTTAPRHVAEILAVDAATGTQQRHATFDDTTAVEAQGRDHPIVVGSTGGAVVVQTADVANAIDLASGKTLWSRPKFVAKAVAGGVVVGVQDRRARALDVLTGAEKWQSPAYESLTVAPGSTKVVIVTGSSTAGKQLFQLLDATSGRVLHEDSATGSIGYIIDCVYDEAAVTVCQTDRPSQWAGAFDDTGKWLWELPAEGRVAPVVTGAWHGAVYGSTPNGPVVLDGRTGADRETKPGASPWLVNEYFGVAAGPDSIPNSTSIFPALS